ncbi:hypothetical protein Tco_1329419 [Tanacetum coccineum]
MDPLKTCGMLWPKRGEKEIVFVISLLRNEVNEFSNTRDRIAMEEAMAYFHDKNMTSHGSMWCLEVFLAHPKARLTSDLFALTHAEEPVAIADATKGIDASESSKELGNQPADVEKGMILSGFIPPGVDLKNSRLFKDKHIQCMKFRPLYELNFTQTQGSLNQSKESQGLRPLRRLNNHTQSS